jgi:hypothetical protein
MHVDKDFPINHFDSRGATLPKHLMEPMNQWWHMVTIKQLKATWGFPKMGDPQKPWVSILKWSSDLDDLGVLSWHKNPPHCNTPTDSFRNQLCLGMEFINYCWVVGERLSQASIILKRRTEDGEATSYKLQPPQKDKDRKVQFSCNLVLFYGLLIT